MHSRSVPPARLPPRRRRRRWTPRCGLAMGAKVQPARVRRPSTRMVLVPAPRMLAPQRQRNAARSAISGSRAAPRRVVLPWAVAAASSSVSVAPTLGKRRATSAPRRPEGAVRISRSPSSRHCAPSASSPERCRSTGLAPDTAAAGQHRLGPAQPRQQRRTEQNGGPHLRRSLRVQPTGCGRALHQHIPALPAGRAACPAQQPQTGVHIGQRRHVPQPHRSAAQNGGCQQRQHAVFRRRDAHRAAQRPPARDDEVSCHANAPVPQKIPHAMRSGGVLSVGRAECAFLFVRSFVLFFSRFPAVSVERSGFLCLPAGYGEHDAHLAQQHHQAGAAGGEKRQADAGVRDGVRHHSHVQHGLQRHLHHKAHHQQGPGAVRRVGCQRDAPPQQQANNTITAQAPTKPSSFTKWKR